MMRLRQRSSAVAFLLLLLTFFEMVHTRYRWVGAAAFKGWARGRCFRCLERGHQVSTCRESFRCIRCRWLGHWHRFYRARFPIARSRSSDARARSSSARTPANGAALHPLSLVIPRHPKFGGGHVPLVVDCNIAAKSLSKVL
jgi:hypothetical protein